MSKAVASQNLSEIAQDPLDKPNIWENLSQNPLDSVMWTMYLGKPWVSMTYQEKENINKWKSLLKREAGLMLAEDNQIDNTDIWGDISVININESKRQTEEKVEEAQYLVQLESMMLEESVILSDLKSNIKANFIIIEQTYSEEFEELGVEYTYYDSKYPNGNYSQDLWVKEKTQELKKLKQKEFEKLKTQLVDNTRN